MGSAEENALNLTKYLFSAPHWILSLTLSLILSLPLGYFFLEFLHSSPHSSLHSSLLHSSLHLYLLHSSPHFSAILTGILLFGIPAVISAPLTKALVVLFGGRTTLRRTSLLSLVCVIAAGAFVVFSDAIAFVASLISHTSLQLTLLRSTQSTPLPLLQPTLLQSMLELSPLSPPHQTAPTQFASAAIGFALGMGFICGFRLLISLAIAKNSASMIFPASTQTAIGAFMFFFLFPNLASCIILIVISSVFFSISAFLFVRSVDNSTKKTLGISGIDLIRSYLLYLSEGEMEMEQIFSRASKTVDVPVFVLAFRRRKAGRAENGDAEESVVRNASRNVRNNANNSDDCGDSTEDRKSSVDALKAVVVMPLVHSGLTGSIGGGNLPSALSKALGGVVFVPHSMTNHDFDILSSDIPVIVNAAKNALASANFRRTATHPAYAEAGDVKMLGQRFGDAYFLIYTLAPLPFDDANFSLGIAAIGEARAAGAKHVAVIDSHNSGAENAECITSGSKTSFDILKCVRDTVNKLKNSEEHEIKVGVSVENCDENIGNFGIRTMVVDVSGVKSAYVLIDGNNMVSGLRDRIVQRIKNDFRIEYAEVMTTDSHALNRTQAYKFVGAEDPDAVERAVVNAVSKALADIEPVEVGAETKIAENIHVLGENFTPKLVSVVNTITSMSKFWIIFAFISSISLSFAFFILLSYFLF